jgi:hypothetical protein
MVTITKADLLEEVLKQDGESVGLKSQTVLQRALAGVADDTEPVDILTYIQAPWGLDETLYPIQRFIIKLIFGMSMNDPRRDIQLWDRFRENVIGTYNEAELLQFLYDEKRCNISPEAHQARMGKLCTTVILRMGRRGSKSTIAQWIAAYTMYKLLKVRFPQEYYNLRKDQPIRITMVATSESQAAELLAPAKAAIKRAPFLRKYLDSKKDNASNLALRTQRNIDLGMGSESGLLLSAFPCSAKSVRGPANILAILEEYGAFSWQNEASNKADKEIHRALSPSTLDFKNPVNGTHDGMLMIVSTPMTKEGHMYTLEQGIWEGTTTNGLVLHIPSAWVNPRLTTDELKNMWNSDRLGFLQEMEAEYLDEAEACFSREKLEKLRVEIGPTSFAIRPGESTWMGVDLGLKNDPTAISVVASAGEGKTRLIHHETLQAGFGEFEELTELDLNVVSARIDHLFDYWGCQGGIYDQWNAFGLKALLKSGARTRLEHVEYNSTNNDRVARWVIAVVEQGNIEIPADLTVWDDPRSLFRELSRVQRITKGGDPPRIKIQAPNFKGFHDDQYSSLSRALWAAKMGAEERPNVITAGSAAAASRLSAAIRERAEVQRDQRRNMQARNPLYTRQRRY